jgi:CheY-like chemotaxis protein
MSGSASESLRILYVEDNPLVRAMTHELLETGGRQVVARATAEEALAEFAVQPFDVVITDVSLPAMSGLELAKAILNLEPAAPIIIASGYSLNLRPPSLGPNVRVISKPFESHDLEAVINGLCEARRGCA